MSASEKLRAHEESGVLKDAWAVLAALPQIVAVVEAAEREVSECEGCGGAGWDLARADGGHRKVACEVCWPQRRALAALDEALS